MVNTPFFSIITASYNYDRTLAKTLESVRCQSFVDREHIVMDGGSTDGTLEILKRYESLYPIQWRSEQDRGIADALNKGIALARGTYIIVIQADDILLDRSVLGRVYALARSESHDIFSFPVLRNDPIRGIVPYKPFKLRWWHHFKTIIPHQGAFVHRRVFERIGSFRPAISIAFDYDFFFRALQSNVCVRYGRFPVALMEGQGISSDRTFLKKRLNEEYWIQTINETQPVWRVAQLAFRMLYWPYKTIMVQKMMAAKTKAFRK